jgi:hypothetical protein
MELAYKRLFLTHEFVQEIDEDKLNGCTPVQDWHSRAVQEGHKDESKDLWVSNINRIFYSKVELLITGLGELLGMSLITCAAYKG